MPKTKIKTLIFCLATVALLSLGQTISSTVITLVALSAILMLICWESWHERTLPVILFYIAWSPLMKLKVDSYSFYTAALVLISFITLYKNKLNIPGQTLIAGLLLAVLTLIARVINGEMVTMKYIMFGMLFIVTPLLLREQKKKQYNLYIAATFMAVGIITSALIAQYLYQYPSIQQYIRKISYVSVSRWCGFYSDPNFFAGQIAVALGAMLWFVLYGRGRQTITAMVLSVLLIYCGLLTASKSFVVVLAAELLVWLYLLIRVRKRAAIKTVLILAVAVITVFAIGSTVFQNLIQMLVFRFSQANSLDDLTSGRVDIWKDYFKNVFSDVKVLLIGMGLSDELLHDRATHNTLLQMLYQVGLMGTALIVWWWIGMTDFTLFKRAAHNHKSMDIVLMVISIFLPWMALDYMYFDEFFIFQCFFMLAVQEMADADEWMTI